MQRSGNPNLQILEMVAKLLGPLLDDMVLIGGCATGLLLTDTAAPPIRATRDVDVITEVANLADYHRLSKKLRQRGFIEDQSPNAPICRWVANHLLLDVMPTNTEILGFGNPWYQPALNASTLVELPSGTCIRLVSAPYFLATKLEAFDGRGEGDFLLSHDIEDLIAVLDGRQEIIDEVRNANKPLRNYLMHRFVMLLDNRKFIESLAGHLPADAASQARLPLIEKRIRAIAKNK